MFAREIGQQRRAQVRFERAPVRLGLRAPVGAAAQMRHRRQHVERVAAGRRQRRIGRGRPVQVEAEVLGQHLAVEDVGQQLAIARPEQDRVVRDVRDTGAACRSTRRRGSSSSARGRGACRSSACAHARAAGGGRSRRSRRSTRRRRRRSSRRWPAARRWPCVRARVICATVGAAADGAALPFDQPDQALHQAAGAAHREVHAPAPLEKGDQAVDRGGGERIAADQQRMEAQHHAQPRIAHVLGDEAVHGAIALEAHQVGQHPRHVVHEPKRRGRAARSRPGRSPRSRA